MLQPRLRRVSPYSLEPPISWAVALSLLSERTRWYWIIASACHDTLKIPHCLTVKDALDILSIIIHCSEEGSSLHYNASTLMQQLIKGTE